jgi:hypothetical protein
VTAARLLRPTLSDLWTFLAVALPTIAALAAAMPAVDLAYQLRAGTSILDGQGIPTTDTWTFTIAGAPWTDQQWLAQVILAAVYRVAGWSGLAILRAGLVGAIIGLLFLVVRRRSPALGARTAGLLVLAAFLVSAPALALRPQLFAMVLFAATLLILADRATHPRRVWLIPVFAALWANVHGSFPLVIALCGLAWLADLRDRAPRHTMLWVGLTAAAATLLNPFGLDVWGYVVRLATNPTIASRVSEWRPPGVTDVPGILFWASVVAVVALLALRARARQAAGQPPLPPWPALLTLAAFAALGALTGRGLAWWPLVAVFVASGFIRDRPQAGDRADRATPHERAASPDSAAAPQPARRGSPSNAFVAGALILAGVALLPLWRPIGAAGAPGGILTYAPQTLTKALAGTTDARAHVWNPQRWGSWLELAAPDLRYALDSRIELYPASVWADADIVSSGTGAWADVLARYKVEEVVTDPANDALLEQALSASGTWVRLYWGCDGSIWRELVGPEIPPAGVAPSCR